MTFGSLTFLVFVLSFLLIYQLFGKNEQLRKLLLIGGNLIFYVSCSTKFLPLLLGLALLTFGMGKFIANRKKHRFIWVTVHAMFSVGILIYFKMTADGEGFPLGLSYLTLQAIAYTINIARGSHDALFDFRAF